ncbi:arabinose operon regulatory protein [Desulfosporosinus acididurans]|uniref:Arabinose operon regulatory protein n=1 Tax=Desulfosporosinus acididurans TaxID=476652 RepID=A0A0J1FRL4_9FIRM|nr:AraC family transcriptional regulator [Desulfosporosinus acididurans]KLU66120.1 arabinose operon regulatory protein [Desulfosporosinus acididurans]
MVSSLFYGNLITSNRILYTPSSFAKTSLIYLQETGSLQAQQPHTSKRENLSSYLFFLILSGSGTLEYDGTTHCLKVGDCVFLDCKKPYSHRTSDDLWKLNWVHFNGPNMSNIYAKYTERGGRPCFHPEEITPYEELLQELYEIASSDDYIRDMLIFSKISSLLTLIMKESWHPENTRRNSPMKHNIQSVKSYLDVHYMKKVNLDNLANTFFINKYYLTRIFKEQFGMSINRYLLQIRITHAKQLLRFTDDTIETIAAECGMGDSNYFARMFKKVEGIAPSEFRETW